MLKRLITFSFLLFFYYRYIIILPISAYPYITAFTPYHSFNTFNIIKY